MWKVIEEIVSIFSLSLCEQNRETYCNSLSQNKIEQGDLIVVILISVLRGYNYGLMWQ